jgi:hypothetical protein
MGNAKRAALYLRVSTDGQTTDNQRMALEAVAEQRGWSVRGVRLGRPNVGRKVETAVRARLAAGDGVLKAARAAGCGTSVAQRIKAEMALPRP